MKKRIQKIIYFLCIIFIFGWLYIINNQNYEKIKNIKYEIIKHPELLPKKDIVKYTSFWFSNLRADIYWLEAIQYIWWNAIWSEYKKYLYNMLDLITELNPFFEKPYLIWQLLLPSYNFRYENLSQEEQLQNIIQWEKIWLKWIKNFCDKNKIKLIKNEENLEKLWNKENYKNPCKTAEIPFSQAFLYYYYLKDNITSSDFYKIASVNDDSLEWSKIMAAIMSWKSWNREKSIIMFLTLVDTLENQDDKVCEIFSQKLKNISYSIFREWVLLTWKTLKEIEDLRKKYFSFNEESEKELVLNNNCWNYINKAIRELNLHYLESANKKYFKENWENLQTPLELFEKWYIDFLPTDFQQYNDYWIIYEFNKETWNFDYKMLNF